MECTIKRLVLYDKTTEPDPVKSSSISAIMDEGYDEEEYEWQTNLKIDVYVNEQNEFIGLDVDEDWEYVSVPIERTRRQRMLNRLCLGYFPSEKQERKYWIEGECVIGKILPEGGIVLIDFCFDTSEEGMAEDDGSYDVFYFSSVSDNPVIDERVYRYEIEDKDISPDGFLGKIKGYLDELPEDYKDLVKRAMNICDYKVAKAEAEKAGKVVL